MNVADLNRGREIRIRILEAIREYIDEHGWAPSIREIGAAVGREPSTVLVQLRNLEREGKIALGGGPRMIRLL